LARSFAQIRAYYTPGLEKPGVSGEPGKVACLHRRPSS
jgi:hypothetical protein